MFTGKVGVNDLSGPVGIVDAVSTVVEESRQDGAWYVFLNVTNFIVMLSANLGVMNLLPIPGLDGGKLLFLIIEVLRYTLILTGDINPVTGYWHFMCL